LPSVGGNRCGEFDMACAHQQILGEGNVPAFRSAKFMLYGDRMLIADL
jgi:hypothetical protein